MNSNETGLEGRKKDVNPQDDSRMYNGAGWAWFEGVSFPGLGTVGAEFDVETEVDDAPDLSHSGIVTPAEGKVCCDVVWQRVLGVAGGADGAEICAQLRAMTLERALGPNAGMQAIWMLEGQRALVLQILRRAGVAVPGR
ncbi:hypothetical protein [Thalassospira sp. TSL5-1]|uniref:Bbp19 family protein n=1 Tax=Thalassospira sp. TSL5-1 TaxID=1544451 RepID=UPI00093C78EB|nr:hypothetical protein [Thalassospira sp. TSL5-1]